AARPRIPAGRSDRDRILAVGCRGARTVRWSAVGRRSSAPPHVPSRAAAARRARSRAQRSGTYRRRVVALRWDRPRAQPPLWRVWLGPTSGPVGLISVLQASRLAPVNGRQRGRAGDSPGLASQQAAVLDFRQAVLVDGSDVVERPKVFERVAGHDEQIGPAAR